MFLRTSDNCGTKPPAIKKAQQHQGPWDAELAVPQEGEGLQVVANTIMSGLAGNGQ